jgi:hypothetical protein
MNLYLDIETRQFRKGLTSAALLPSIMLKRGDVLDVSLQFVSGFSAVTAGSGATGKLAIKREPADDYFLALAASWTGPGNGQTAYSFSLDLFTDEMEEVFETEPTTVSAVLEIEWVTASETLSSVSLPVTIENHVIRGSEGTPTPATSPTPVVEVIADVPDAKDDFFMFPGGVAPTTGMYMASDANYNYTMKGGWTYWRRAAIAMWLMLAAMTLAAGAQYDMPYIQQDGSGDNQERIVTLTPSTFLSVSANGTLQVQSSVDFKLSLGLATVATSGNYSDLSGKPSLFSGNFTDIQNTPTTLQGYGITGGTLTSNQTGGGVINVNAVDAAAAVLYSENGAGVSAFSDTAGAVSGESTESVGVTGISNNSTGVSGFSWNGEGLKAETSTATQIATFFKSGAEKASINSNGTLTLNSNTLTLSGNATLSGNNTGDQTIISFTTAPATSTSNGTQGTLIQEGNWLYICVATNTWRRIELLNW